MHVQIIFEMRENVCASGRYRRRVCASGRYRCAVHACVMHTVLAGQAINLYFFHCYVATIKYALAHTTLRVHAHLVPPRRTLTTCVWRVNRVSLVNSHKLFNFNATSAVHEIYIRMR